MAGNIKGICIEFQGDTTKLDKALRQIKNSTKDIDRELKNVDRALKFNPTSVELWRQKQDLLRQRIKQTEDNLKNLKNIQAQMDAQGVDKQSEAYRRISREIVGSESKLKTFNAELRKIGQVNLRAMSEQIKQMGSRLEEAGQKMKGLSIAAAGVVTALGAAAAKSAQWADDLNTMSKVYGISTKDLQKYAAAADLVDVSVETVASSHVKLEKSMASAASGSKKQAEAFETLGINVKDANGNLRDSDEVWQEVIQGLGKMENETERDAVAMQLMGKSATELNPLIEDCGETYQQVAETFEKYGLDVVDQETLDKANQFQDELDTIKMIGMATLQNLGAQLAGYLAPALEKVVEWVGKLSQWLQQLSPQTLTIIGIVAAVVAALAPVLIIVGKVATGISSIISLVGTIGPALGALAGPVGIAIAVIGALIAVGVLLYKNWDKIKAKAKQLKDNLVTAFNQVKSKITAIWNSIKNAITKPIQTALNAVRTAVNKIKSIINGAKLKLPHFKLPHFKINGGKLPWGIGGKGYAPSISVNWYKEGGIFDQPSLIGLAEAGAEAVVPLDKLWDKLDRIADSSGGGAIVVNVYGSPGMDVNELAEAVERRLATLQKQRSMAWT